jgi:hypothetical protein
MLVETKHKEQVKQQRLGFITKCLNCKCNDIGGYQVGLEFCLAYF